VSAFTIGGLFSGIGGLELGLERGLTESGLEVATLWQVEAAPFCRAVLARHWPEAERYDDVRTVGPDLEHVDLLTAGFPCQDISVAGRQAGITKGSRSGLFYEVVRIARVVRPQFIVLENVSAITASNGGADLAAVLGELAALGIDGFWDCIPAAAVGAPHRRDRWFFIGWLGNAEGGEHPSQSNCRSRGAAQGAAGESGAGVADAERRGVQSDGRPALLAGAQVSTGREGAQRQRLRHAADGRRPSPRFSATDIQLARGALRDGLGNRGWRYSQPGLGGTPHGLPAGVDPFATPRSADAGHNGRGDLLAQLRGWSTQAKSGDRPWQPWEGETPRTAPAPEVELARLKALGNAVVPQVAEVLGLVVGALVQAEQLRRSA